MSTLEQFERGDAIEVPVNRIEAELAALWRQAAGGKPGEKPKAVTRACLWNLVVRALPDSFAAAKKLIDEVSATIPARVILLHSDREAPESPIRAWVEANWRRPEGGHGASGSDEVTLQAGGAAVDRLPSLVRALLITDAPTAMLWWGPPPGEAAPVRELLREVGRLIVDTRKLPTEAGMVDYARLAESYVDLDIVDCAWVGVRPLRGQLAALFDQEPGRLQTLDRVRVVSGVRGCQSRGLLTLGWLGSRLGWRDYRKQAPDGDVRRWRAARRDGGDVVVELETRIGGATHGVRGLELHAGSDAWTIKRENQCMEVTAPGQPCKMAPVRTHPDSDLVVWALGPRGRDVVFGEALAEAARLVSV